ncbi:MAG TPA: 1-acyl-sn-glycerol-3-phosphate acyltransferase [Rhodocyclaceae bacterium]|nr:1-acyl-sn-glycerol-3-phosphate acyltransferase [Rhodocyclaceae bacterium]
MKPTLPTPSSYAEPLPAPLVIHPRAWAKWLLHALGWRFNMLAPPEPKALLVVYPHTSNWDFLWGILTRWACGWPMRWVAKHTLFFGPIGWLLRQWGGVPINRQAAAGFVDSVAEEIRQSPAMLLVIAPEGTRSYRDHWKSGFYRIARAANIPIGIAYINYATRTAGVSEYFRLSGDESADLARIAAAYANLAAPRHPAKAAPIVFKR